MYTGRRSHVQLGSARHRTNELGEHRRVGARQDAAPRAPAQSSLSCSRSFLVPSRVTTVISTSSPCRRRTPETQRLTPTQDLHTLTLHGTGNTRVCADVPSFACRVPAVALAGAAPCPSAASGCGAHRVNVPLAGADKGRLDQVQRLVQGQVRQRVLRAPGRAAHHLVTTSCAPSTPRPWCLPPCWVPSLPSVMQAGGPSASQSP